MQEINRVLRPIRGWIAMLSILALTPACTSKVKADYRAFMKSYLAINQYAPIAERRKRIEDLARVELETPEARQTRDLCVKAHHRWADAKEAEAVYDAMKRSNDEGEKNGLDAWQAATSEAAGLLDRCREAYVQLEQKALR